MIINKEEFKRLISAFLDNEASVQETQKLFDCVRANTKAKDYFLHCCAMHKSLNKLYDRKIKFQKMAGINIERLIESEKKLRARSKREWLLIAGLFTTCVALVCLAIRPIQTNKADDDFVKNKQNNFHAQVNKDIKCNECDASILEVVPRYMVINND